MAGYGASPADGRGAGPAAKQGGAPVQNPMQAQLKNMRMRLWVSFAFLTPLMYVSMGSMAGLPLPGFLTGHENAVGFALTQLLLTLPVVYVNRKYYEVGFKTLLRGSPNMDSLIAIGSTAALVYGVFAIYRIGYGLGVGDHALVSQYHMDLYFESAAMILALITLGKYLETRSKGKTSEAITKLMDLAPKTAAVERGGMETVIPVEEVVVGDTVLVRPGQSVPVDGVILEGNTSIDEAAITGESIPVEKEPGSTVIAATINKAGFFKFRATKVGADTTLAQIIRLVEDASSSKAPIAKLADKNFRRVRAGGHRHCSGGLHRLASRRADAGICGLHRYLRAGHFLSLRAGSGHARGHHGGHGKRGGKRNPHQIRRGVGDGAQHQRHRA